MKDLIERLRFDRIGVMRELGEQAATAIEKLEAENAALKTLIEALHKQKPVAWGIEKSEQLFFGGPDAKPFAKAWKPLYAAPGAKE